MSQESKSAFYEVILIFHPNTTSEDWKEILSGTKKLVEAQSGEWLHTDTWGKRPLANLIKEQKSGFYFHCVLKVKPSFIVELERPMRYNEKILRFLYVRLSEKLSVKKYIEKCHEGFRDSIAREKEREAKIKMRKSASTSFSNSFQD